jgi:hypothetical protein
MIIKKLYNNFILVKFLCIRCLSSYSYFSDYDAVSVKSPSPLNPPYIEKIEFLVSDKETGDLSTFATNAGQYSQLISSLCTLLLSSKLSYSHLILSTNNSRKEADLVYRQQDEFSIEQRSVFTKKKEIDRFLKLLSRSIEINGPLEKVLYYQNDFVNTLTVPMSSFSKTGFLKFESTNDFESLNIFARIHFNRGPIALMNNKTLPLFEFIEESSRKQQIFAK